MKKINRNLGPKFREIRNKKGLSLEQVSSGIISFSTVSRWETNKQDIDETVFHELLKRLRISPNELENSQDKGTFITEVIDETTLLYANDQVKELAQKSKDLLASYSKIKNADNLLAAATACNFYLDLTENDLTDETFKAEIFLALPTENTRKVVEWYESDINLFTNSQLLLNPQKIYDIAQSLASKAYEFPTVSRLYSRPLFNAVFILMKKKHPQKARRLFKMIKNLPLDPYNEFDNYRQTFLEKLLNYIADLDDSELVQYFSNSDISQNFLKSARFSFNQIKAIYS